MTQIADVMTRGVRTLAPYETIAAAAKAMEELDVGAIPVCEGERLLGVVTDRDLVIRGVAQERPVDATPLSDVMTADPTCCYEDQTVEEAAEQMREQQIRRLPIIDRQNQLVGMLSLGDLAVKAGEDAAAETLEQVSEPAAPARPVSD